MAYLLVYSKRSAKDISKLDNLVKKKLKQAIEHKLLADPFEHSVKLKDFPIEDTRRLRVGNYRILFTISGKRVEILRVGHRRDIYR